MMSRRRILLSAVAAGAAVGLPSQAAATATGRALAGTVPETLAAFSGPGRMLDAPGFAIGHLGVAWSGPRLGGSLRFRTAPGWGPWQPLVPGDSSGTGRSTALVPAGGAIAYQVTPPPDAGEVELVAINTTDGPPVRRPAVTGAAAADRPADFARTFRYVDRAGWGADESLRFAPDGTEIFPQAYFAVQTLTVHHTVTANVDPDPAATVRAIYFFHTLTQDFGDLGYHLLIDQNGAVHEGRYSGPDSTPVFQGRIGDGPLMCNAAHVGGFNAGNVGVALLGDLTGTQPTAAARKTLVQLLAVLARITDVDPLGQVDYVNPISGATRTVPAIAAHRNWSSTACPGDAFHPELPAVRTDVARLMAAQQR